MAGVLIEAELPFLLVGIGVNVRHKPEVPQQGPDRGRPAACLADFGVDSSDEVGRVIIRVACTCTFLFSSPAVSCRRTRAPCLSWTNDALRPWKDEWRYAYFMKAHESAQTCRPSLLGWENPIPT